MAEKSALNLLVEALVKAKQKFKPLEKDKTNPFFKSKYADLHAVYESVGGALAENGLVLVQPLVTENGAAYLHSRLIHVGGGEIDSKLMIPPQPDMQKLGAAVTYGKRTSAMALLGIAAQDEDDDGESVVDRSEQKPPAKQYPLPPKPAPKPVTPPAAQDSAPNVLGKIASMDSKVNKAGKAFYDIIIKPDGAPEERIILLKHSDNKAQEDAISMLAKDLEGAMMGKQYVEVSYTVVSGNKMYAGSKIHKNGEEPKL